MDIEDAIYLARVQKIEEKFPDYKAFVQAKDSNGNEVGDIIDIFCNETINSDGLRDEDGVYSMTIEQALYLTKLAPSKNFFLMGDEPYYDYITSSYNKS